MDKSYVSNILFKIGSYKFLKEIIDGQIYMQPLKNFRKIEEYGIGDPEEGLIGHFREGNLFVRGEKYASVKNISTYACSYYPIFCAYVLHGYFIRERVFRGIIPGRLIKEFSQKYKDPAIIAVLDYSAFNERFCLAADKKNSQFCHREITYLDRRPNCGEIESCEYAFIKDPRFSYQTEYRYMLFEEHKAPIKMKLGNLSDIVDLRHLQKNMFGYCYGNDIELEIDLTNHM